MAVALRNFHANTVVRIERNPNWITFILSNIVEQYMNVVSSRTGLWCESHDDTHAEVADWKCNSFKIWMNSENIIFVLFIVHDNDMPYLYLQKKIRLFSFFFSEEDIITSQNSTC